MTALFDSKLAQLVRLYRLSRVSVGLVMVGLIGLSGAACGPASPPTITPAQTATIAPTEIPVSPTIATPSAVPSPTASKVSASANAPLSVSSAPASPLEQALALVPIGFADSAVEFADYSGYLELRGAEHAILTEVWPYEGLRLHPALQSGVGDVRELLGMDLLESDFGIWAWEPGKESPKFFLNRGGFEGDRVVRGLLDMEYLEEVYSGNSFYALGEDFEWSIRSPLRVAGASLNRVAVVGDWFLAAPATGILEELIDLQNQRDVESLLDSEPHRVLVDAVGGRPVGGAFVAPKWVMENWNTVNTGPVERLDKYLTESDQWGQLSSYSLAFIGYVIRGEIDTIALALFYPNSEAATADAVELERRWNSFHYNPSGRGLIGAPEYDDVPLTGSCAPFSTTLFQTPEHSVLVGTCPAIRDEDDPSVKGPGLWTWLFSTRELQFLAPNLAELRKLSPS